MSLRDEIERICNRYGGEPRMVADAVLALLREGEWHDEAVERMTYAVPDEWTFKAPEVLRPICARLLLAAVGGEGQ
jgi:hypothetical protein